KVLGLASSTQPTSNAVSGRASSASIRWASFLRGHCAQIGHDGVEVVRRDGRIIVVAHGRLEPAAVATDPLRNGPLDVVIGPGADTLLLARSDVARDRNAPRSREFKAAGPEAGGEIAPVGSHRRVTFHAVCNGGEVETFFDFIVHHRFGERLLA